MSERQRDPDPRAHVYAEAYREMIGRFATGVGVVTAAHAGQRFAMTANSITSVSVSPRLLLASFMRDSETGAAVRKSGRFGLSILEADTGPSVARRCAVKLDPHDGDDQLAGIATYVGPDGIPLIQGALECFVCAVEQLHSIGDHDVAIGRAVRVPEAEAVGEPLVFYEGSFWLLDESSV